MPTKRAKPQDPRKALAAAARDVRAAEADLAEARKQLRQAVAWAQIVGEMSLAEIGRELGISRQRVAELLREATPRS